MSNLSLPKGKQNIQGLNFADIVEDVTYLPDPGARLQHEQPGAGALRLPVARDPIAELKVASHAHSSSNRPGQALDSPSNSFEIVDAVSQDVSRPFKGSQISSAGKQRPPSGSQIKDSSSNLSDKIASVQSYVIQTGSASNSGG